MSLFYREERLKTKLIRTVLEYILFEEYNSTSLKYQLEKVLSFKIDVETELHNGFKISFEDEGDIVSIYINQ